MVVVVDYGVGNLGSIANMLKKVGAKATVSSDPQVVAAADKLLLPGVGHFDHGMRCLRASGLVDILNTKVLEEKVPVLGVCLGAQMLGRRSEEGSEAGLGWLAMDVVRFPQQSGLRIPHMGWRVVEPVTRSPLFADAEGEQRFYFVHSYYMRCDDPADVLCEVEYGVRFAAAVSRGNIHGVQFHPEKSHRFGAALLRNFLEKC